MSDQHAVTLDDLHAYADGQLSPDDIDRIDLWLAQNPDDAARFHAYRVQNAQIRRAFSEDLISEIPSEMRKIVTRKSLEKTEKNYPWRAMIAALWLFGLGLGGGLGGGWFLQQEIGHSQAIDLVAMTDQTENENFIANAVGAHRIFVSDQRHPVEVPGDQQNHLVTWLSKRLQTPLQAPDLQNLGYLLVGGRLLSDRDLPAAQFMYEDSMGQRLTLFVRATETEDQSFEWAGSESETAFYWIDNKFAYALIAPMSRDILQPIASQIYRTYFQE